MTVPPSTTYPLTEVPDWVVHRVRSYMDLFGLNNWEIHLKMMDTKVQDSAEFMMQTLVSVPEYMEATIFISQDVSLEKTPAWDKALLHEMIHIVLGTMTVYVQAVVIGEHVDHIIENLLDEQFIRHLEQAIQVITRSMYQLLPEESHETQ